MIWLTSIVELALNPKCDQTTTGQTENELVSSKPAFAALNGESAILFESCLFALVEPLTSSL